MHTIKDSGTQASLEDRIAETGRQIAALQGRVAHALAELAYARRRAAADLALARDYALEDMAQSLLPFKDALEAALAVDTRDALALKDGLALANRQLSGALARGQYGVHS